MKTSNYILIAVFTLVVISTLTFFITSRQHENENNGILRNSNFSEIPLPEINVIVAKCPDTFIRSGAQDKLLIIVKKKKSEKKPEEAYHIGNDTLYIDTNDFTINVICSHSVSAIVPKDGKIYVGNCELNCINIENTGGYVDLHNSTLDTLLIRATDKAGIRLHNNRAKFVSVQLKDMGDFYLNKNEFEEIDIKGLKN